MVVRTVFQAIRMLVVAMLHPLGNTCSLTIHIGALRVYEPPRLHSLYRNLQLSAFWLRGQTLEYNYYIVS